MDDDWTRRPLRPSVRPPDYFHTPSPARMWNYLQGGGENFALDRASGDAMAASFPDIFSVARQVRHFLMRAVRYVADEGDVHQFLDLGCGLPVENDLRNVHDVAQEVHPDARVVYVDNDKVVISHADALLTSNTPEGETGYLEADVRDTESVLTRAADTLDFDEPVAVIMLGILGHVADHDEACSIINKYMAAVPTGSYLVVNDGTKEEVEAFDNGVQQRNETGITPYHLRSINQLRRYFEGLELVEPGIVSPSRWRPAPADPGTARPVPNHCGVAHKAPR